MENFDAAKFQEASNKMVEAFGKWAETISEAVFKVNAALSEAYSHRALIISFMMLLPKGHDYRQVEEFCRKACEKEGWVLEQLLNEVKAGLYDLVGLKRVEPVSLSDVKMARFYKKLFKMQESKVWPGMYYQPFTLPTRGLEPLLSNPF